MTDMSTCSWARVWSSAAASFNDDIGAWDTMLSWRHEDATRCSTKPTSSFNQDIGVGNVKTTAFMFTWRPSALFERRPPSTRTSAGAWTTASTRTTRVDNGELDETRSLAHLGASRTPCGVVRGTF